MSDKVNGSVEPAVQTVGERQYALAEGIANILIDQDSVSGVNLWVTHDVNEKPKNSMVVVTMADGEVWQISIKKDVPVKRGDA